MVKRHFNELPVKAVFRSARLHQHLISQSLCGTYQTVFIKMNQYQFSAFQADGKTIGQFEMPYDMAEDPTTIDWHNCPMYQDGQLMAEGDNVVAAIRKHLVVGVIEKINLEQDSLPHLTVGGVRIRETRNNKGWSINRDSYASQTKEARKIPL